MITAFGRSFCKHSFEPDPVGLHRSVQLVVSECNDLFFFRWGGCCHPPTEPSSVPFHALHALMTSPVSGLALDSSLMSLRCVVVRDYKFLAVHFFLLSLIFFSWITFVFIYSVTNSVHPAFVTHSLIITQLAELGWEDFLIL